MPDTKRAEVKAIYEKYMPTIESITKQIENAKTQKQKDKLYKQRADITHKANNEMNAFLNDFDQLKQVLMKKNLFAEKDEIKALKEADFDFENPFSFHNVDKTRYKQSWGSVDTKEKEYTRKLIQTRLLFDRFDPVIRWNIKGKIYNIDSFSKGIKDDEILALPGDLKSIREDIEILYDIKPIKEFGTNYAEHYHSGESAIQKLISEAQAHKESGAKGEYKGQVAGAFHRKELGDIDLVWGEVEGSGKEAKGYGLAKIIEKHGDEFEDIAKEIDGIIQDGKVVKTHNGYNIELGDYKVGLNIGWNEIGENKWVVTAFDKSKLQSEKQGSNSASLTKGETLPLNSKDIIPQQTPKEMIDKNKGTQIINTIKDLQDKEVNTELGAKDLLGIYKKSSRESYDKLSRSLSLESVRQYRDDGYALFENLALGNTKAKFEAILKKNLRDKQIANLKKPDNVKYEIQTEQGFIYYLDKNGEVISNHKNELVDFNGGKITTKPDKDGDVLVLNGRLTLISPRNVDKYGGIIKRDLTAQEFYNFHANLKLANYYQNGLLVSDEKLYEIFKNMPRKSIDTGGLGYAMDIFKVLTNSKNLKIEYAQEFIDKHYGTNADYKTFARDIFKRIDKQYKKNGKPFGILFNDELAIKYLRDEHGDTEARDYFKGSNAIEFLLYKQDT